MPLIKPPEPNPMIEPFRDGVGELRLNGELAGHVATSVGEFWSPGRPLRLQWWVWMIVVWADGTREPSFEDCSPWITVTEMADGCFVWEEGGAREGRYEFSWLTPADAEAQRTRLGIKPEDF